VRRAWSVRETILACGKLTELDLSPIRVAVDVNVGYTHSNGWNVYSGQFVVLICGFGCSKPVIVYMCGFVYETYKSIRV